MAEQREESVEGERQGWSHLPMGPLPPLDLCLPGDLPFDCPLCGCDATEPQYVAIRWFAFVLSFVHLLRNLKSKTSNCESGKRLQRRVHSAQLSNGG